MSVNLYLSISVRDYRPDRVAAISQAIQQVMVSEQIDEDMPPLAEKKDGQSRILYTESDRDLPIIISRSYEWLPRVQELLLQAAQQANSGPCQVVFEGIDADDEDNLEEDDEDEDE